MDSMGVWYSIYYHNRAGAANLISINGVTYTSAQLPVYGRVTYQAASTTVPLPSRTDDIRMPLTANVGETMIITMRSWNTCNALDNNVADANGFNQLQGGANNVFDITRQTAGTGTNQPGLPLQFPTIAGPAIFANNNPVLRTYTLRIMTKPTALTPNTVATPGLSICYTSPNSTAFNFSVLSTIGGSRTTVKWYNVNPQPGGAVSMANPNGANSLNFPAASYTAANSAVLPPFRSDNAGGAYYSVWPPRFPVERMPVRVIHLK